MKITELQKLCDMTFFLQRNFFGKPQGDLDLKTLQKSKKNWQNAKVIERQKKTFSWDLKRSSKLQNLNFFQLIAKARRKPKQEKKNKIPTFFVIQQTTKSQIFYNTQDVFDWQATSEQQKQVVNISNAMNGDAIKFCSLELLFKD